MSLRGRRVLVTGAAGFVGRHTVAALSAAGAEVRASSRRGSGVPEPSVSADLLDEAAVQEVVLRSRPHHIVHLGGAIARPGLSFRDLLDANVASTQSVLAAAAECSDVESVLVAGSSAVYGRLATMPLSESAAVAPTSAYGVTKAAQELVAGAWRRRGRYRVTVARLFNVVGPGQPPELALSAFARQIVAAERGGPSELRVGRLDTRRDYVDVRDVARALTLLLHQPLAFDEYNVASGVGRSVQHTLDLLLRSATLPLAVVADPALMRPDDVPVQVGDSTRLRASTGWEPVVPFEQTVVDLLERWRREPEAP